MTSGCDDGGGRTHTAGRGLSTGLAESEGPATEPNIERESDGRRVVSIVGPTASGKTSLAIALAEALGGRGQKAEIVNADAYQMYRGMRIGTAQPTDEELSRVAHHLVGVIEPDEVMTAARFQTMVRGCIRGLRTRGVRPILVGGSGLYARAALDDISFPGTDAAVRTRLEARSREEGPGVLFRELQERDPQAASHMDPRNVRRTIRALEVIDITGRPYSASLPRYRYAVPAVQIGLDLDRAEMDRRIDERTRSMRDHGLVDEVRDVRRHWGPTAARALGYQQIVDYLDGLWSCDEAFDDIARRTRRLARKQMGWFGRDPRIHWIDALNPERLDTALAIVDRADSGAYDATDARADEFAHHPLGTVSTSRSPDDTDVSV
ncbi:tRNA (adenosine(37)-N6)-dimethylallyltransferase MiaA [uncultured Bifidobacterium sp.]|uniref:tRNA (adenosine(37)-N6)-dimethylallyltransferase MiaA n=1 Tax=uncultured Bifidobacterium sp. TaxID=165187 RepID=UPI00260968BD|nr:tRNA (adenosine(37)-N6)-dimethylallyltransferase MiaA [uncultured Bifidobacterium sp.]